MIDRVASVVELSFPRMGVAGSARTLEIECEGAACCAQSQAARKARTAPARKRRGTSSSSGIGGAAKGSNSSGAHDGPCPGALQSAASVLLSFSAMTE